MNSGWGARIKEGLKKSRKKKPAKVEGCKVYGAE